MVYCTLSSSLFFAWLEITLSLWPWIRILLWESCNLLQFKPDYKSRFLICPNLTVSNIKLGGWQINYWIWTCLKKIQLLANFCQWFVTDCLYSLCFTSIPYLVSYAVWRPLFACARMTFRWRACRCWATLWTLPPPRTTYRRTLCSSSSSRTMSTSSGQRASSPMTGQLLKVFVWVFVDCVWGMLDSNLGPRMIL